MLNDPLYLPTASVPNGTPAPTDTLNSTLSISATPFRSIPSGAGKSVRVRKRSVGMSSETISETLSVSNSLTKENSPYTTQRSVLRVDAVWHDTAGKPVTGSAYLVIVAPKGTTYFTDEVMLELTKTVAATALVGGASAPSGGSGIDSSVPVSDLILRILQGES